MSKLELAEHVATNMSFSELLESAIIGINELYESDEEKYENDMCDMGFEIKDQTDGNI